GIAGTTWGLVRAERALEAEEKERERAERERDAKEKAAAAERLARKQEAAERRQAEAVAGLLESVFQGMSPDAESQGAPDLKEQLLGLLDRAAANLEKNYAGEPLTRARLQTALGTAQLG